MTANLSMICSKQSNGTYFAICPEIKGCFTQGDTYEDAAANLKELVEVTIKEEFSVIDKNNVIFMKNKFYSEFEVVI